MYRKKRIFSTPDRTCHWAPRFVEFLAIRLSLAVSTASCRHPIQLSFWLRESNDLPQNERRIKLIVLLLKMMLKSYAQQKRPSVEYYRSVLNEPPPRSNARRLPATGSCVDDLDNRQNQTPYFDLIFFCITFLQKGGASWLKFVRLVLSLVSSSRLHEKRGGGKMALIIVETVPTGIKPPAVDDNMRTSTSGKCGFCATALLLTRASPVHFSGVNKRGSAIMPKLVKLVGPTPTLAEELSSCLALCCSALRTLAGLRVWFYVCLRGETWLPSFILQVC